MQVKTTQPKSKISSLGGNLTSQSPYTPGGVSGTCHPFHRPPAVQWSPRDSGNTPYTQTPTPLAAPRISDLKKSNSTCYKRIMAAQWLALSPCTTSILASSSTLCMEFVQVSYCPPGNPKCTDKPINHPITHLWP